MVLPFEVILCTTADSCVVPEPRLRTGRRDEISRNKIDEMEVLFASVCRVAYSSHHDFALSTIGGIVSINGWSCGLVITHGFATTGTEDQKGSISYGMPLFLVIILENLHSHGNL